MINSTIAKEGIEIFFPGGLSTFWGKRRVSDKASGLIFKHNFYNEIPSTELRDLYSKQAKVYKRDGLQFNRHF